MVNKELINKLETIAKTSFIVLMSVFLSKVFLYIYKVILVRKFGPEVYGLLLLAITITSFFTAIATLGLIEGILRFIPLYRSKNAEDKIKYIISFTKKILLFTGIFIGFILYISSTYLAIEFFKEPDLTLYLRLFSILLPIQILSGFYFGIIRAYEKISIYSFGVNILQGLMKVSFLLLLIFLGVQTAVVASGSYILGAIVGLAFAYTYFIYSIRRKLAKFKIPNSTSKIRYELLAYSGPLILSGVISNLVFWLDTFFIGFLKNAYSVGIYNIAVPIALLLTATSEIFMQVFFPLIAREISKKNLNLVNELSKQISKWVILVNIPLTSLMLIFPGEIIALLFGAGYSEAIPVLRILVVGQLFYSLTIISNNLLLANGKSKTVLMNLLFTTLLNVILNYYLIIEYGIIGGAIATTVSLILLYLITFVENYVHINVVPLRRKMIGSLFSAIIAGLVSVKLLPLSTQNNLGTIISIIVYSIVYLALILLTKTFDKNDRIILKQIKQKYLPFP